MNQLKSHEIVDTDTFVGWLRGCLALNLAEKRHIYKVYPTGRSLTC